MNKKNLIIGKNSKIVKDIKHSLDDSFVCVSHRELNNIDFDQFGAIFLFSWDFRRADRNEEVVRRLPLNKTIFISSMAVKAFAIRGQWAAYPRVKRRIEDLVLSSQGSVLRLGLYETRGRIIRAHANVPICNAEILLNKLFKIVDSDVGYRRARVFELFILKRVRNLGLFDRWVVSLDRRVKGSDLFSLGGRFILFLILKIMSVDQRSYTADVMSFYPDILQVGYGALGSTVSKRVARDLSFSTVCSFLPDAELTENGFNLTRVGKLVTGLAKFWHGVYVVKVGGGYEKRVPLLPYRPRAPAFHIAADVVGIDRVDEKWLVRAVFPTGVMDEFVCNRLILAAGALENCRLLGEFLGEKVKLSDHQIGEFGTVEYPDFRDILGPKKFGFFVYSRKVLPLQVQVDATRKLRLYLEFRPVVADGGTQDINFYNRQTKGIIFRLFSNFSVDRLNEAFFNKFGFGVYRNRWSVFAQILNPDSIVFEPGRGFSKTQLLKKDYYEIRKWLELKFPSFRSVDNWFFVDGQHPMGGRALLENDRYKSLQCAGQLVVLGSPSAFDLGIFHHTQYLRSLYLIDGSPSGAIIN
jgi:hypothetical protein